MTIVRVGLDIAKKVPQIHGVDARDVVRVRKSLVGTKGLEFFAQLPPGTVGMETCADAHFGAVN